MNGWNKMSNMLASLFTVPKLFIQSHIMFVGSLQNETNHNLKQTDPVTVNITAIFRILYTS